MARGSVVRYEGPRGVTWRATVDAGKRPDGSRHQLRRSFRTKRQAEQWLAQTIATAEARAAGEPSAEPLGSYLDRWLKTLAHSGIKPATEYRYRLVCARRFSEFQNTKLRDLTPALIEAHYSQLAASLAPSTISQAHAVLRRALDAATRLGDLRVNPCLGVRLPKARRFRPTTWTAEQARRFYDAAGDDVYGVYWRVALETMAREGELTPLRWDAVDLDAGRLTVRETRTADRVGKASMGTPKSEAGRRTIELSRGLVEVLRRHRERQEDRRRHDPRWNASGYLFPNRCGGAINSAQAGKHLKKACKALGLPQLRVHDLRHTGATLAIADGVSLKIVSERLGHRDTRTTLALYVHPDQFQHREAAEQIARIFAPSEGARAPPNGARDIVVPKTPRRVVKNRAAKPRSKT